MTTDDDPGLLGIAAVHHIVRDVKEARRFYVDRLDFREVAASSEAWQRSTGQHSMLLEAGKCRVVAVAPLEDRSEAARYLRLHPPGIGAVSIAVRDAAHAFRVLEGRGATPIDDLATEASAGGRVRHFAIATPMNDVRFRFVERIGPGMGLPGLEPIGNRGGSNRWGFRRFDHLTANVETMTPALLWYEQVLGLRRDWDVELHTSVDGRDGSGLRSVVVKHEAAGITIATNEPLRPDYDASQVARYCRDQRGGGIQHVALLVDDIAGAVAGMRRLGVRFKPTPAEYYDVRRDLLSRAGDLDALRRLGVLLDGDEGGGHLLQIFMDEGVDDASPFFYEVIQRCGHDGFGTGNFRALFEAVERARVGGGAG